MRSKSLLMLSFLGLIVACAPEKKDLREAEALFQRMRGQQTAVTPKAIADAVEKSIAQYIAYSDTHPNDPLSPEYLLKAAQLCENLPNQSARELAILSEILARFPRSEFAPKAMMAKAHIYRTILRDTAQARSSYAQFLQKFPAHELAPIIKKEYDALRPLP